MATRYFLSPSGTVLPPVAIDADKDEAYLYKAAAVSTTPKLIVDAARLVDIAATVYSEAWKDDPREGEAITRIIRNRAEYTLHMDIQAALAATNFWLKVRDADFKGRNGLKYKNTHSLSLAAWIEGHEVNSNLKQSNGVYPDEMRDQLKNVVRGLVSDRDITFGAYFFDGTNGLASSTHKWRATKTASDLFAPGWKGATIGGLDPACAPSATNKPPFCGNTLSSGETEYQPEFVQTCVYGKTTFFKKNPAGGIFDESGRMVNANERAFP